MVTKEEVISKINNYLNGKVTKKEISQWAIQVLSKERFSTEQILIEDAVTALSLLHDENERFDTANEDLSFYIDCLSDKKPYGVKIEFLPEKEAVV
ncbi:MAG: hypothetical protein AUJ85_06085 [Elusimicrobia bacterium CG1_02_37_114]|nr:MAG: hypothetical protein AUJ85_06085 [Elusimicrobia bacterium CG1_02_37_114]PIV52760.1 MAG: hypothetical protein COS17_07405 [Elusimicrobia bacterium CG02_land_8_20_14_3_00_37_13]PIZ12678.1 MAG: hypothetical protein COY53_08735 [Elusimicrobia bacterium CG_4_10_14_0_8_um_filter_37_32]